MQSGENEPVRMTSEEFDKIRNTFGTDLESEEFLAQLHKLGIALDSGPAEIVVDGERMQIATARADFGTVIEDPNTPFSE